MKWWLVLVAFVLGLVVTWLLTTRRDGASVPGRGTALSEGTAVSEPVDSAEHEADNASAFGGAPSEFSSDLGAAESWHRDWEDEDALMTHEPAADTGETAFDVPPVDEATPNGDLAGVGEPEAVRAVDAVEVDPEAAAGAHDAPATGAPAEPEHGTVTGDTEAAAVDEKPDKPTPRA